jgi:hypothetical protein
MLHAEALELGSHAAMVIAGHARSATQPTPPTILPRPGPTPWEDATGAEGESCDILYRGTERLEYLVSQAEIVSVHRPRYRKVGRNRRIPDGVEIVREKVEYCPLTWLPPPFAIEDQAYENRIWLAAMARLWKRVRRLELRDHVVEGHGITNLRYRRFRVPRGLDEPAMPGLDQDAAGEVRLLPGDDALMQVRASTRRGKT